MDGKLIHFYLKLYPTATKYLYRRRKKVLPALRLLLRRMLRGIVVLIIFFQTYLESTRCLLAPLSVIGTKEYTFKIEANSPKR